MIKPLKPYTPLSKNTVQLLKPLQEMAQTGPYRPAAHLAPPCGLMNDPNGLCFVNGRYHVFYQWYPFEAKHDMKHWYHVSSENLTDWIRETEMLIPDQAYEKNGCYSGNAYVCGENVYLYYTANYKDAAGRKIPKQALAVMDQNGKIKKSEKNPIIQGSPKGIGANIRDPFVFEYKGDVYMLLGAETEDGHGALLLYSTEDLESWSYCGTVRVLLNGKPVEMGTMVECPGLIETGGQDVLFLSFIGLEKPFNDNRFHTAAYVGTFNPQQCVFEAFSEHVPDAGFDFYAPQPFYGKNREPMFYAWFGCGDQQLPEDAYKWRHGLSLPRQIIVEEGRLRTPPVEQSTAAFKTTVIDDENPEWYKSSTQPTHLHWALKDDKQEHVLKIGTPYDYWSLKIDFVNHNVLADRSELKQAVDAAHGMTRQCAFASDDLLTVDIYLDNSFNEVYINGGEQVLSLRSYEKSV